MNDLARDEKNRRILVVDDNEAIHDDFRKILGTDQSTDAVERAEAALFGETTDGRDPSGFEIDSAHQGEQALDMVRQAN